VKLYKKSGNKLTLAVALIPAEEGGFCGFVLALPGCGTQGETAKEVIDDAMSIIPYFYKEYSKNGLLISSPTFEEKLDTLFTKGD
jgi:predicted RNase H-like HicB family nuclease